MVDKSNIQELLHEYDVIFNGKDEEPAPVVPMDKRNISYYISKPDGKTQMFKAIHELLECFDFKTIAKVMKYLKWEWATDNGIRTPNEKEIERMLLEIILDTIKKECRSASTAGFYFYYDIEPPFLDEPDDFDHCVSLHAMFCLDEYHSNW